MGSYEPIVHLSKRIASQRDCDATPEGKNQISTDPRQTNQLSKSLKALSTLPPEDVRRLGVSEELISGMSKQLEALKLADKKKSI